MYVSTVIIKNVRYSVGQKNKIRRLYTEIGKFMEQAFYKFETEVCKKGYTSRETNLGAEWLKFVNVYRKEHKIDDD